MRASGSRPHWPILAWLCTSAWAACDPAQRCDVDADCGGALCSGGICVLAAVAVTDAGRSPTRDPSLLPQIVTDLDRGRPPDAGEEPLAREPLDDGRDGAPPRPPVDAGRELGPADGRGDAGPTSPAGAANADVDGRCGNGVLDDGEACDPPGPACGADCSSSG
jgi:hypothetical protein